ncbi:bifunctional ENTH-VHS/VHS domain [Babesia duncani]|uniref:Bifunctional ENTH-VHS/VHS domain n=1 Tax=Babesia duncani TaxID=323732 RepID=A0AAD9UMY9_9APIC|nr:bifunctional ENTH-VHS/VHS domain [Babesia duncani]
MIASRIVRLNLEFAEELVKSDLGEFLFSEVAGVGAGSGALVCKECERDEILLKIEKMDDNLYHRSVPKSDDSSPEKARHYSNASQSHNRGGGSQQINFKSMKSTGINAAKSLTSKILNLSNSGIAAATIALNNYKESQASHSKSCVSNENSFERIQERISNTQDPITTHRELVAMIECALAWKRPPVQTPTERDCFGAFTQEIISRFRLLNYDIMNKILGYVEGRRDCCLFIIKFTTWRMRTTKHPEEVLLSLEMLETCMERFGSYFLALFSKALMRTFRKLMLMTTLRTSIVHGVRKHLAKLLVGSSGAHPGVATDPRIHIIKSKTLYMVQLWHDTFLLEQGIFPVFFEGYRSMRTRGVRFPTVNEADKAKINKNPVNLVTPGIHPNVSLSNVDLDEIMAAVNILNDTSSGPEYEAALRRLGVIKQKLVVCIQNLVEDPSESEAKQALLERMLRLNSAIDAHNSLTHDAGSQSSARILAELGAMTSEHNQQDDEMNLLVLDTPSDSDDDNAQIDFESHFTFSKNLSDNKEEVDFFDDLNALNFGNPVLEQGASTEQPKSESVSSRSPRDSNPGLIANVPEDSTTSHDVQKLPNSPSSEKPKAEPNAEPSPGPKESQERKKQSGKSLQEMLTELDNIDVDFGHMSMTGF